ncbi:MAG: SUF system NifU family Fe-S cluster assembly protein [Firmicutes bacterium ZCTH02-B6]|nr:MAG: SUF system NifU family Fe-S cluster assembly protein [Firmicutes bacterium ZCTH02-B6]
MQLNELYRDVIMDHYRRPRNKGTLEDPSVSIALNNPVCGDEITLQLLVRDGRIERARFMGRGCSISQASASMMAQQIEGKTLAEAEDMIARFKRMMHGDEKAGEPLGDLMALHGVSKFPVRVKCALLSWEALERSLEQLR